MPDAPPGRRLLWIHQNFVSARQAGISRAVYFLTALVQQGWTVDVICRRTGYLDEVPPEGLTADEMQQEGTLTLHRLGIPQGLSTMKKEDRGKSYFSFNKQALQYARKLPRPDVIFSSSPPLTVVIPALQLAWRWRAPLLLELRDLWPAMLIEAGLVKSKPVIAAMQWFEAFCVQVADHLIPVAPGFKAYYEQMGVPPERMTVNPTGGDPVYLQTPPESGDAWRHAQGLEGKVIALFTGSMNEISGVDVLADVALLARERMPEVVFVFAGKGRLEERIIEAAADLPNVRYLGSLARDELAPVYAAADIGLIVRSPWPFEELVYPGKLFDYLSAGLPVVTSHLGQPALVVEEASCGAVVRERSAQAIYEALRSLVQLGESERQALGQAGRAWLLGTMNAYRMGEALERLVAQEWPRRSLVAQAARYMAAACGATTWSLAGHQRRAVRAMTGPGREALLAAAYRLSLPDSGATGEAGFRLPMPGVLSSRDDYAQS